MIEVDVTIVIRQRKTFPKELPCSRPPYSSRFYAKWDKLYPTRRQFGDASVSLLLQPRPFAAAGKCLA